MIQRQQTLWFLFSLIIALAAFYLPFGEKSTTGIASYQIKSHDLHAGSHILLTILFVTIIILNLGSIFLFKRRDLQKLLSIITILVCIAAFSYELYFSKTGGNNFVLGIFGSRLYLGILLPILSLISTYLALRSVISDERLLKQSERLR